MSWLKIRVFIVNFIQDKNALLRLPEIRIYCKIHFLTIKQQNQKRLHNLIWIRYFQSYNLGLVYQEK